MGTQSRKKAHKSQKENKNLFEFFKKFQKIYINEHLTPTPKLYDVLIVKTKASKSKT